MTNKHYDDYMKYGFKSGKYFHEIQRRIALFGDSVIDNGSYLPEHQKGMDTLWSMRMCAGYEGVSATEDEDIIVSYAVDGSVIKDVMRSIGVHSGEPGMSERDLFISAGGNDLLHAAGGLTAEMFISHYKSPGNSELLEYIDYVLNVFRVDYEDMLRAALVTSPHVTLANIYDIAPNASIRNSIARWSINDDFIPDHVVARANEIIADLAMKHNLFLIDLNKLAKDVGYMFYANDIEPSYKGGNEIAVEYIVEKERNEFQIRKLEELWNLGK